MDNTANRELIVFPSVPALCQAMCTQFVQRCQAAIADRGRFTVALSGGRTPQAMYSQLKLQQSLPWKQIHLFWGDERYVPHDHPQSNYRMVREALLDAVPIPPENVHPMPTHLTEPEEAAEAYELTLRGVFGQGVPTFDMLMLGMGSDGHTASLFPGTAAVAERERLVVVGHAPVEPAVRLSLSLPVLLNARQAIFMVTGEEKRAIVREIFANPAEAAVRYPAALVHAGANVIWFVDEAASPIALLRPSTAGCGTRTPPYHRTQ